jgi:hypothetical protein
MRLHYIQDPSHGWIGTDRATLQQLGIDRMISSYSYGERAPSTRVWLEEDYDAGILINALDAAGINYIVDEEHLPGDAWIRALKRYEA